MAFEGALSPSGEAGHWSWTTSKAEMEKDSVRRDSSSVDPVHRRRRQLAEIDVMNVLSTGVAIQAAGLIKRVHSQVETEGAGGWRNQVEWSLRGGGWWWCRPSIIAEVDRVEGGGRPGRTADEGARSEGRPSVMADGVGLAGRSEKSKAEEQLVG